MVEGLVKDLEILILQTEEAADVRDQSTMEFPL